VLRDAVFGGIAGIVIGGVIGAASHPNFPSSDVVIPPGGDSDGDSCTVRDTDCTEPDPPPQEPTIIYREPTGADLGRTARSAAIGAAAGAVAGAIVGRITTSEVWKQLPFVGNHVHVALQPNYPVGSSSGTTLRFSIAIR
jgi:hypothetical protein